MGPERRIVIFNWVTADGAGPDGGLEWVVPDDQQAKAAAEAASNFDTALYRLVRWIQSLPGEL